MQRSLLHINHNKKKWKQAAGWSFKKISIFLNCIKNLKYSATPILLLKDFLLTPMLKSQKKE